MITRRTMLAAAASAVALPGCTLSGCSTTKSAPGDSSPRQIRYGEDNSQVADLYLPAGDAEVPVAVVIHGGFWMSSYGKELATPLAQDLAKQGIAGYAIEYRRIGNGGGWPATFDDVAAAIDALAGSAVGEAGKRLDLAKVVAVGHSAGGQLAVWAAARPGLPADAPGSAPKVRLVGAVSQAGVLDLVNAANAGVGGDATTQLMGATPEQEPARYQVGSPYERLPLKVPVALVHGTRDGQVPIDQSRRYRDAAKKAGDQVRLTELPQVGHFELIDPHDKAWLTCRAEVQRLLGHG